MKERKPKPLKFTVKPTEPITNDGKFADSYGNPVSHGTKIVIESNYNFPHWNNRPGVVEWDSKKGMYRFRFTDGETLDSQNDFHGIHSFRVIEQPSIEVDGEVDFIQYIFGEKAVNCTANEFEL